MFWFCCFFLPIAVLVGAASADLDSYCQSTYVLNKDFYPDPQDCHFYVHCQVVNASSILGTRMPCANGTYWSTQLLQCVPEGSTPCFDNCVDDAVAAKGCYGGGSGSCATFYRCSNSVSYQYCCPVGTSFKADSCACDWDATCKDACFIAPYNGTLRPPSNNGTQCNDSYGNMLEPVDGYANRFNLIDLGNSSAPVRTTMNCALGTEFNLTTCECSNFGNASGPLQSVNQCIVYLPFDHDLGDHSINAFVTRVVQGNVIVDNSTGTAAALFSNGGQLQIDGLKNVDFQSSGSWCLFYSATSSGALMTNGDAGNATFTMNQIGATMAFTAPLGVASLQSTGTGSSSGFQQICVTLGNDTVSLYVNKVLAISQPVLGNLAMSFEPYWIGSGDFNGYIDDILICRHAMTQDEIDAHYRGDLTFLAAEGLIPGGDLPILKNQQN